MQKIKFLITSLSATLFIGCTTIPTIDVMKAETANFNLPYVPQTNNAVVYVTRPSDLGGLIRFNVFVDNQEDASEVGFTRNNQYIYCFVKPGEHKIYSKAENWAEILINPKAGETVFLRQEPAMGIIMARNSLFKIDDHEGKFHVKTLNLGTILKTEK